MATTQRAPPPNKKSSFVPLRLGPVGKSKTLVDTLAPPPDYALSNQSRRENTQVGGVRLKYPRIIVRDAQGRTLDTFTTLQEAIYRANWTRKKRGEWPKTQLEWRLPKAPVPSKPDFTRAGSRSVTSLPLSQSRIHYNHVTGHDDVSRGYNNSALANKSGTQIDLTANVLVNMPTLEIPVDDVSFIAQSLQHLPELPSFSFLRHSLLAGQETYVQIVASILLHQRHLQATDSRENDWEFPGFCTGCKRSGLCYGCVKSSKPHIHEDIPAWTGGGFRFWKPDRPRDPFSWKNPNNWKLPRTEDELQDIIRKYGGLAAYERAVIAARREMITDDYGTATDYFSQGLPDEMPRLERITTLGTFPPQVTIVSSELDKEFDETFHGSVMSSGKDGTSLTEDGDGSEEHSTLMKEMMMMKRMERARDRSRSHESRRRRIGVTSYKEDSISMTSRSVSAHNPSVASESSVRIDTGFGDELDEGDETLTDEAGTQNDLDLHTEHEKRERKVTIASNVSDDRESTELTRGRKTSRITSSLRSQSDATRKESHASSSSAVSRKTSRLTFKDEQKELQEADEARKKKENSQSPEDDEAIQSIPFARKRKETLYKAPKFFVVHKKTRRITDIKDPFSKDRELNVPKGPAFQIKKGEGKHTKFVDFKKGKTSWTAPKAFEVKHADRKPTKFWSPTGRKDTDADKKRRKTGSNDRVTRSDTKMSSDSGLHSNKETDGTDMEDSDIHDPKTAMGTGDDQLSNGLGDGDTDQTNEADQDQTRKPKRREVVKKSRVERAPPTPPPQSPPRLPSPPPYYGRKASVVSISPVATPTPPPEPEVPLPEIDFVFVPELPELGDKEPESRKQKMKFAVEAPPALKEMKKKRRPPPKVRIIPKGMYKHRKTRPAEAPVTQEDMLDIQDPLDFLAKYCIINPDRLPFYEIVFESTVAEQEPVYSKKEEGTGEKRETEEEKGDTEKEKDKENTDEKETKSKKGKPKKKKSSKEREEKSLDDVIKPSLLPTHRGMDVTKVAMTIEEQYLEKLIYTLDLLHEKTDRYSTKLAHLDDTKTRLLAERARDLFPEVTVPDYSPKVKQKGKKGKKNKIPDEPPVRLRPDQITDDVIVARLDDKMLTELTHDPDIRGVNAEMSRLKDKIADVQNRVQEIASEKLLADAFCMNHFFLRQGLNTNNASLNNSSNAIPSTGSKPPTAEDIFRRQQSELYNRLHPDPDYEMNLEEVEGALQQINNHLLTEKEFAFLYNVLNLPRRTKVNFRLFSIIAALSEKVTQLDPVIKHLMNNFNYNALDIKMEKCKELFDLLEADNMPSGAATASSLVVELTAGRLKPEHIRHVLQKFNRENRGVIDFLDFVTYVPLFVEIHKRIVSDPLQQEPDL